MKKRYFEESELILNPDGSIYHLHLMPEQVADNIIVVGDPGRVSMVSKYFDTIEFQIQNRELVTHTGMLNGKRVSAISTGMGTDNIDIVLNELDALANINLKTREEKEEHRTLNIIRIGTSGSLQGDVPVDSFVMATHGLGLDGLMNFYKVDENVFDREMAEAFIKHSKWLPELPKPYIVSCSSFLEQKIGEGMVKGITATACGFFGPQGRVLRLNVADPQLNDKLESFNYKGHRITNFEMETSALYGLGKAMGHNTLTVCVTIANRVTKTYSSDYKKVVDKLVQIVLQRLTS
ncbi:MAG TPA: nucleoside phosphorylase [Bacteroidales bacterium]|nr:nucleoside phosphorylase [Bacteroidales bacterium]